MKTFNFARLDKETARKQWKTHFENRTPISREPKKVEVKAAVSGQTDIMLYDEIGFWGITAKDFNSVLASITTPSIRVRINSPGGDVFDGLAIYSALKEHPSKITCQVDGIAASAASFIALAADNVVMAENALMMIHPAWGMAIGNKSDMLETATILEKIDTQLCDIYSAKCKKSKNEVAAMMDGEGKNDGTWFTAQEAMDYGLIDSVMPMSPDEEDDSNDPPDDPEEMQDKIAEHFRAMRRRLAIAERE